MILHDYRPLYDRVLAWSRHPHAERYLGAMSFAESSFFPDTGRRHAGADVPGGAREAWRYAAIATVFSVLGGLGGYAIGCGMFDAIEPWLARLALLGCLSRQARDWFDDYGVWVVFVAGFSPIPYKVFTIAAGVAALDPAGLFRLARSSVAPPDFFLVAGSSSWVASASRRRCEIHRTRRLGSGCGLRVGHRLAYGSWLMRSARSTILLLSLLLTSLWWPDPPGRT